MPCRPHAAHRHGHVLNAGRDGRRCRHHWDRRCHLRRGDHVLRLRGNNELRLRGDDELRLLGHHDLDTGQVRNAWRRRERSARTQRECHMPACRHTHPLSHELRLRARRRCLGFCHPPHAAHTRHTVGWAATYTGCAATTGAGRVAGTPLMPLPLPLPRPVPLPHSRQSAAVRPRLAAAMCATRAIWQHTGQGDWSFGMSWRPVPLLSQHAAHPLPAHLQAA